MNFLISLIFAFSGILLFPNAHHNSASNELSGHILEITKDKLAHFYSEESFKFQVEIKRIPSSLKKLNASEIEDIVFINPISPKGYERAQIIVKNQGIKANYSNQLQLHIKVWQKLPLLKVSKQASEPLEVQDFFSDWYEITRLSGPFIQDLNEIEPNLVLARMLQKGQPIRSIDLTKKAIIEAGDNITLVMNKAGFSIQILCVARQDGALGEEIRCYSEENRKTYAATIIQKGLVQWKQTY